MSLEIAIWQVFITVVILLLVNAFKRPCKRASKTVERSEPEAQSAAPFGYASLALPWRLTDKRKGYYKP